MSEDFVMDEDMESPLSPNSIAMILGNLFRKDTNGEPIDFYLRRTRLLNSQHSTAEFTQKMEKLRAQIEECGGCLKEEPFSGYSIELAFPEMIDNLDEIDSDLFKTDFVEECIKRRELLDLEDYRMGKSPYDGSVSINSIMKGLESWDSVKRSSTPKGRKLPDFGMPLQTSPIKVVKSNTAGKKGRVEYTTEEDLAILKFLLKKNLYDKVGGNTSWKIVHREFPNHSFQSLQNRFRRTIFPNLEKYKGLTESERNLFHRGSFAESSLVPSSKTKETNRSVTSKYFDDGKKVSDSSTISSDSEQEGEKQYACVKKKKLVKNGSTNRNDGSEAKSLGVKKLDRSLNDQSKTNNTCQSVDSNNESNEVTMSFISPSRVVVEESQLSSNDLEDSKCTPSKRSLSPSSTEPRDKSLVKHQKNTKRTSAGEFSIEEDVRILKYIIDNKKFSEVSGTRKLWIDIQDSVFKESEKNWKSIKRRFQRVILPDIESEEYGLDRKDIKILRKRSQPYKSSTSSEDDSDATLNEHTSDSDSRTRKPKSKIPRKSFGQRLYTLEEDKLMIDYIVKTARYEEVRGKILWVDIQDKVLHPFERTWESAKTRFLRTILKDLSKYRLSRKIIEKFQSGAVAERNLGGARREPDRRKARKRVCERDKDSEEEVVPVKHPALVAQKPVSPAKKQKRQLYRQPVVPLPVVFSPHPGPSVTKNPVGFSKPCVNRILTKATEKTKPIETTTSSSSLQMKKQAVPQTTPEAITVSDPSVTPTKRAESLAGTAASPAQQTSSPGKTSAFLTDTTVSPEKTTAPFMDTTASPVEKPAAPENTSASSSENPAAAPQVKAVHQPAKKLRDAPCVRCSVLIKRLTQAELKKYGCENYLRPKPTSSPPAKNLLRETIPPHRSRFTVEISSTHLAARLSAFGTSDLVDSVASASSVDSPQWLPLSSSLSRQSLRSVNQSKQAADNDINHDKPITSNSPRLNCDAEDVQVKDKMHHSLNSETNSSPKVQELTNEEKLNIEITTRANPSTSAMSSKSPLKSQQVVTKFLNFKKIDLSSDEDYRTPNNTDGYQTPDG